MSNIVKYKNIIAFHPGYYVAEIIEDMGISRAEFAARVGTTTGDINALINGQTKLSLDMAEGLSATLRTSVDVWLNLQEEFNRRIIEIERAKDLDLQKEGT